MRGPLARYPQTNALRAFFDEELPAVSAGILDAAAAAAITAAAAARALDRDIFVLAGGIYYDAARDIVSDRIARGLPKSFWRSLRTNGQAMVAKRRASAMLRLNKILGDMTADLQDCGSEGTFLVTVVRDKGIRLHVGTLVTTWYERN